MNQTFVPRLDRITEVLESPCTHRQLKAALEAFLQMDPVDAANDADLLAELMDQRVDNFL
jgi:hypothetical protein